MDCLFFDGTFYRNNELIELGTLSKTSLELGHIPIRSDDGVVGSMDILKGIKVCRKIYTHLNNTNPLVVSNSPERLEVEKDGFEVAEDGMKIFL